MVEGLTRELSLQAGGDLKLRDNDGLTPLSLLNQDRRLFKSALSTLTLFYSNSCKCC